MIATIVFLVLCILALLHFVYESIIAPTLRLALKYRLFALRDELRCLAFENAGFDEVFDEVEDSLNGSLYSIDHMSIGNIIMSLKVIDDEIKDEIKKRQQLIEVAPVKARQIWNESAKVFTRAVFVNNLVSLIIFLPIFLILYVYHRAKETIATLSHADENQLRHINNVTMA